ncbi:HNH endonuclease [Rhodococcus hoagii]|uniref:HNH endonuclease n=1 Tax=Rhodococcus hoagii TaxID=43767 RepID=A0A9Q4ZII6_RHOHA|nr:HNH endonuclease [Prescottella equi]NKT77259.1 HNH endonuclease [Prescottella equi]NKZ81044.1 HNH endonuclease [Prescottella equi]
MPFADNRGEHTSDHEYRKNRPLALQRDGHRCQLRWKDCTGAAEEVDHIRNFKAGGSHDLSNLQSVCRSCHKKKTAGEAAKARAIIRKQLKHRDTRRKHPGYK